MKKSIIIALCLAATLQAQTIELPFDVRVCGGGRDNHFTPAEINAKPNLGVTITSEECTKVTICTNPPRDTTIINGDDTVTTAAAKVCDVVTTQGYADSTRALYSTLFKVYLMPAIAKKKAE